MSDSIFTKIIKKEIPADILYEDEDVIAIKDINPQAPIHILVITKTPYQTLEEVNPDNYELHAKLLLTARKLAKDLGTQDNYKLLMNVGKKVQAVHHIHLHLLGGWDSKKKREELDKIGI